MFVFGHMGIGSKLVSPWSQSLPKRWLLLGTLVPDLIDKPLYYLLSASTGLHGAELGLIGGTRTFGHTGALALALTIAAFALRSRAFAALSLGNATHLILDSLSEAWLGSARPESGILLAILFPFLGFQFPVYPFHSAEDHLRSALQPRLLLGELAGIALLGWDFWKSAKRPEILARLRRRGRKT